FHFTALRTLGTAREMIASRRFPISRFQPGIALMYACTGASPSPFAICGLPPERSFTGFALCGVRFACAPVFDEPLDLLRDFCERDSGIVQRTEPPFGILDETDHVTVATRQHDDASDTIDHFSGRARTTSQIFRATNSAA